MPRVVKIQNDHYINKYLLFSELTQFTLKIAINSKTEHSKPKHDSLVFTLKMSVYQNSKRLFKNSELIISRAKFNLSKIANYSKIETFKA